LKKIDGVQEVVCDLSKKSVVVEADANKVTPEFMLEKLEKVSVCLIKSTACKRAGA